MGIAFFMPKTVDGYVINASIYIAININKNF